MNPCGDGSLVGGSDDNSADRAGFLPSEWRGERHQHHGNGP